MAGEYAELEEEDVRLATSAFLREWRLHGKNGGSVSYEGLAATPRLVKQARRGSSQFLPVQHPPAIAGEGLIMRGRPGIA